MKRRQVYIEDYTISCVSAHCTVRERLERLRSAINNALKQLHYLPTRGETPPETPEGHLHNITATVQITVKKLSFFCIPWRYMRERKYNSTHSQPLPRYPLNRVGACLGNRSTIPWMSSSHPSHYTVCAVTAHSLAGLEERTSHAVDAATVQYFYIALKFDRVTRGPHDKRT
jgi:hypothetical protein